MDPRELLNAETIAFEGVQVGMWVGKTSWRRPRLVLAQEECSYFVLAEPDTSRQDEHGNRRVTREIFEQSSWVTYPHLTSLWSAAFSGE
jgi:hypothetical protein